MKVFVVTRPYCTPQQVAVFADTQKEAKNKVRETFGFVENSKAEEVKGGIILTKK